MLAAVPAIGTRSGTPAQRGDTGARDPASLRIQHPAGDHDPLVAGRQAGSVGAKSPGFELLVTTLCHPARLDDLRPELGVAILPQLREAGGVLFHLPVLAAPSIKLAQSSIDAGELDR